MLKTLTLGLAATLYLGAPVPTYAAAWHGAAFTGDLAPIVLARGGSDDNGSDDHGGRGGDDDRADDDRGHGESGHGRGRGRGRGGDDGADHDMDDDNDDDGDRSGRDRPRVPGGSGCDDPEDILEHPECTATQG